MGADQTFCYDTRLSTRDNAGDLIAYIHFVEDIRGLLPLIAALTGTRLG